MGKSIRSKRMRRNRRVKRTNVYGPKEEAKLKDAIAFEYNDQTEKAHLSIFHNVMNGPPPPVPGLEPGSKLARAHLTLAHDIQERNANSLQNRSNLKLASAKRALTRGVESYAEHPREKEKRNAPQDANKMDDEVVRVYDPKTKLDQFGNYPPWYPNKLIRSKAHHNKVEKRRKYKAKGKGLKFKPRDAPKKDKKNDVEAMSEGSDSE